MKGIIKLSILILLLSLSGIISAMEAEVRFGERPFIDIYEVPDEAMEEGRIWIKFREEYTRHLDDSELERDMDNNILFGISGIDALNRQYEVRTVRRVTDSPALKNEYEWRHRLWGFHLWYDLRFNSKEDIREIVVAYRSLADIISWAEPEYKKELYDSEFTFQNYSALRWTPNDPRLDEQWHYNNTGQEEGTPGADISLFAAWDLEKGHPDVIVAIIDDGIQTDHPDLGANMWSGIGYNFVDDQEEIVPGNHGTHVAGTVAAVTNNNVGVAGVAGGYSLGTGVRLMSCQVFRSVTGGTLSGGFAEAAIYAADNGAAISQNSWGWTLLGHYNQLVLDSIDYFNINGGGDVMSGGISIYAAHNQNRPGPTYPACYSGTFSVAATNNQDQKAWYSNFDTWVDISAPGGETNDVTERGVLSTLINDDYGFYQGTSMACPHVSGVAALMISYAYRNNRILDNVDVANILRDTVDDHYTVNPDYYGMLGTGRLNAFAALQAVESTFPGYIGNPRNFTAEAVGINRLDLSWQRNFNNHNVLLVWSPTGEFGVPVNGTLYQAGQYLPGGGFVLYRGNGTSFSHSNLLEATRYHYKIFSYNVVRIYSSGVELNALTGYESFSIPFFEDFNDSYLVPDFWETHDNLGNQTLWKFGSRNLILFNTTGDYAYMFGRDYGIGSLQNTDLITPRLDLSQNSVVSVEFKHRYVHEGATVAEFFYSIDDGNSWTSLQSWTASTANPAIFYQQIPEVAGQPAVRFRWNYRKINNFENAWYWAIDDFRVTFSLAPAIGVGTEEEPYQIANMANLYWIYEKMEHWDKHFIQVADIDAADTASWFHAQGWQPIGNNIERFTGTYDGQGYLLSDLSIDRMYQDRTGLFGYTEDATLKDINLVDVSIEGSHVVGALVGYAYQTIIKNCSVSGFVSGMNTVGGLVGKSVSSTISDCVSLSEVVNSGNDTGGLVGKNEHTLIERSFSSGIVNSEGSYVGGLTGTGFYGSTIYLCYSESVVNGNQYVGGLAGYLWPTSNIENCYSRGMVYGNSRVGGLAGRNVQGAIINCYSISQVSGSSIVGGLVGNQETGGSYADINNYWNIETSGQSSSAGGEGRTTEEMTYPYAPNTYVDWDFLDIWLADMAYLNNGYPMFQWQGEEITIISVPPFGGDGTPDFPYLIESFENLFWITENSDRWSLNYIQTADINAHVTRFIPGDNGWLPIGNLTTQFTGTYDGQGYTIDGLYINRPGLNNVGLFGRTSGAVIKNLALTNVDITGYSGTGGLVGTSTNYSFFSSCYTEGSIQGYHNVGGVIGYNNNSTISNSFSMADVNGSAYVGGLVGYNYRGAVMNCYATGEVTGNAALGGLAGGSETGGIFEDTNNYWDIDTSGQANSAIGNPKHTEEMTYPYAANTYVDWDFLNVWRHDMADLHQGYPFLSWQNLPLSGTLTIKTDGTGNFTSFNQAVDYLFLQGVKTPVVIEAYPGIYPERLFFNGQIPGTTAVNTVTFDGLDNDPHTAIIRFGPNQVTSRHVIGLANTRHLRFQNLKIETAGIFYSYGWVVHMMNGCQDIIITDCHISTNINATTSAFMGIVVSGSSFVFEAGASGVRDINITGNTIVGGWKGISIRGVENDRPEGINIIDNEIMSCFNDGIYVYYATAPLISGNRVDIRSTGSVSSLGSGVYISYIDNGFELSYNTITNPGQYGVYCSYISGSGIYRSTIYNNMIGGGFRNSEDTAGMHLFAVSTYTDIYYNSVNLDNGTGAAIYEYPGTAGLSVFNNSFSYTGSLNGRAAYYIDDYNLLESDYNNYYSGTSNRFILYGQFDIYDLSPLQDDGHDHNSHIGDPMYVNATDLHIQPQSSQLWQQGIPIAGIYDDIDGDPRHEVSPCIGADEYQLLSGLEAPVVNVIILDEIVYLDWEEVDGASSYRIYASEDPYDEDWGEPVAIVGVPTYQETVAGEMRFYRVTASIEIPAAGRGRHRGH